MPKTNIMVFKYRYMCIMCTVLHTKSIIIIKANVSCMLLSDSKDLITCKVQASILGLASAVQELASNCNDVSTAIYAHIIHAHTVHRRTHMHVCWSSHTAHKESCTTMLAVHME